MSYEPTLIVERKDLEEFEEELALADTEEDKVAEELLFLISNRCYCEFKEMELYVFQPEFSSHNKKVREWLDKHNIQYGEHN